MAMVTQQNQQLIGRSKPVRYVAAVGPRLKSLLAVVFALFAFIAINSIYLVSVTIAGTQYQGWFYQIMFLVHLVLGLLIVVPAVVFGAVHIGNARNRPNRRAIKLGYALFTTALVLFATGFVLTRVDLFGFRLEVKHPAVRSAAYWAHVVCPLVAIWLFILHRLAGPRIRWKVGLSWGAAGGVFAAVMVMFHTADPRAWNVEGPESGERYFFPSLARTSTGNFIPAEVLQNDGYCMECHKDIHDRWSHSVHKFSSFNNPPYEFSVKDTRKALMARDGNVQGSRFCAGCHDPVPFFSGAFDHPKFDDPEYDLASDAMAQAGITCTVCHSISHINSVRGNSDYTITEPIHYPFAFSDNPVLKWVNRQLVKAKPQFHKATFLKPLHTSTEFCGTCHKVHLPEELNAYKFLRGQNHYDAFWLSGVSGQGITSFYYPPKAETNCNGCHMPLMASGDFGARFFEKDESKGLYGKLAVHNHMFPTANTAIPRLVDMPDPDDAVEEHQKFLEGVMRVDLFGIREGGRIDGELIAPLRPEVTALRPGGTYLIENVIRTVKMGHVFTQGTADSNEIWMDVTVTSGDRVIGRSGGMNPGDGEVDPWSHFVNAFVLDRDGNRIDRRNAQDIFIPLYSNQIPPGAADVVHYLLRVPNDVTAPVTVTAALQYRKFDTTYMKFFQGDDFRYNDLPITTLATDAVTFPIEASDVVDSNDEPLIPLWQRWNDYGIGLFRKGDRGELRGAEHAFKQVELLGRPDGPLNLARVYLKEGRVTSEAPQALRRASEFDPPANEWSILWFNGLANKQNGKLDQAISSYKQIVEGGFAQAVGRGFDFSKDYRVLNELANTLYLRAKQERGSGALPARTALLREAADYYNKALAYDPENVTAHYGLKLVYVDLGDTESAKKHAELHAKYKPDDNARDYAIAQARMKYPAANKAAEAVVIYDLHRPGTYGLPDAAQCVAPHDNF
jgi:tetratricopeptide (TPR) repeat protein